MTRDHVVLWVNGTRHEVRGYDAVRTVSDYVRNVLRLTGTKTACGSGDCGSCTVLLSKPESPKGSWYSANACLLRVAQIDGYQLRTVESCANVEALSVVQTALIDAHGSQCGFCTPGFVMSITAALQTYDAHAKSVDWPVALAGNLCRCTGYVAVFAAAKCATEAMSIAHATIGGAEPLHTGDDHDSVRESTPALATSIDMLVPIGERTIRVLRPHSVNEALRNLAIDDPVSIVAGATDLGVEWSDDTRLPATMMFVGQLQELGGVTRVDDASGREALVIGAAASWTELQAACESALPALAELLVRVGGPQIRNLGTIGGNLVTGSSISDIVPFMLVMDATVELRSLRGTRTLLLSEFLVGPRSVDCRPDELLIRIRLPLPTAQESLHLEKVSRRKDVDIATVTLAVLLHVEGATVHHASIAVGGAGPIVKRLAITERFLCSEPDSLQRSREAASIAAGELAPRSDVRGSEQYRNHVVRNLLISALESASSERQPSRNA